MRKSIFFILLIAFFAFIGTEIVYASFYTNGFFGGKIISTKAKEIILLESTGYACTVLGTSISVSPIGSPAGTPTEYLIPFYVTPKTRTTPKANQLILGKYSGQTIITCKHPKLPDESVSLTNITLFGTSR